MSKLEIEAGYIRHLITNARGLEPKIEKMITEVPTIEEKEVLGRVMRLLGYISALNENNNESK